jgi:hypothetical protein
MLVDLSAPEFVLVTQLHPPWHRQLTRSRLIKVGPNFPPRASDPGKWGQATNVPHRRCVQSAEDDHHLDLPWMMWRRTA